MLTVLAIGAVLFEVTASDATALPNTDEVKSNLLSELTASFRHGHDEDRLLEFEETLRPMFVALPKNSNGNLGPIVARYALDRSFIQKHGWSIEGLGPIDVEREATPISKMNEWMPNYLVETIQQLLGTSGLNLRELAIVYATFEDLIHREAGDRLSEIYDLMKKPKDGVLHEADAFDVIKAYMTMYTSGGNATVRTKTDLLLKKGGLNRRTKAWLKEVQVRVAEAHSLCDSSTGDCGRLNFKAAKQVVEEIGEQYRTFNEHECDDLAETLVAAEETPGHVKLSDFYNGGLHGSWNFTETPEYLRALGALDESGSEPRLLIPNYVASRPNCLATSSIYVVCCRNQCESLMSELERKVAGATATPDQILQHLKDRDISDSASTQLNSLAAQHGGHISLHSHMFAQWLHAMFPRSCPKPHGEGITKAQVEDDERQLETGESLSSEVATLEVKVEQSPGSLRVVGLLSLLLCAVYVAWTVLQDVCYKDGKLCFNQFGAHKKYHKGQFVHVSIFKVIALTVSLIGAIFVLDALMFALSSWTMAGLMCCLVAGVLHTNRVSQKHMKVDQPLNPLVANCV